MPKIDGSTLAQSYLIDVDQRVDFRLRQRDHVGVGEQAAVEPEDDVAAVDAALGHGLEQRLQQPGEHCRIGLAGVQQLAEQARRQQHGILAEHAEHELHEEVGRPQRLDALVPHAVGQFGESLGRLDRNRLAGDARLERVGIGEDPAEDVQIGGVRQPGQVEDVDLLGGAGEIRVDLEAVHVADDHQRRVLQGLAVQLQLLVGRLEVLVLPLVLPGEMVPHPNVGPALLVFAGFHAFLEGVPSAIGIGLGRLGLAQ